jgi:uncharacterized hydrophobic protein (TIGR00341 family)
MLARTSSRMFKLIDIVVPSERAGQVVALAQDLGATEVRLFAADEEGSRIVRIPAGRIDRQGLIDRVQALLGAGGDWRLVQIPTELVLPRSDADTDLDEQARAEAARAAVVATREELYASVSSGGRIDRNFIVLTTLSTVVATLGLVTDNVAVVIGAMVIAPLLGPNLALSLGIALGDRKLVSRALAANAVGMGLVLMLSLAVGYLLPIDLASRELIARTNIGYDGVAIALASGAAAVLSLTNGLSNALVGVMVAVALLPPAATCGMMIALGHGKLAAGAALLLGSNLICVNFAAQIVLFVKRIKPRTWLEREAARQSMRTFFVILLVLLGCAMAAIALRLD